MDMDKDKEKNTYMDMDKDKEKDTYMDMDKDKEKDTLHGHGHLKILKSDVCKKFNLLSDRMLDSTLIGPLFKILITGLV